MTQLYPHIPGWRWVLARRGFVLKQGCLLYLVQRLKLAGGWTWMVIRPDLQLVNAGHAPTCEKGMALALDAKQRNGPRVLVDEAEFAALKALVE